MARYHGKSGGVYGSTTGAGVAAPLASLSKWSLSMATDKVETTSFNDPNKTYVQGLKDVKGTFSGFWDNADDSLFDGADSADGVRLYLYPATSYQQAYFYGPAWLDASIDVDVNGAVTVTGNFVANGAWGRKP